MSVLHGHHCQFSLLATGCGTCRLPPILLGTPSWGPTWGTLLCGISVWIGRVGGGFYFGVGQGSVLGSVRRLVCGSGRG